MSEVKDNVVTEVPKQGTPAESTPAEQMIPKHRFDEVYANMKALQEQLDAINADKAQKEKEELEKTNQFKTLYEQQALEYKDAQAKVAALESKATAYEGVINNMVETKLAKIPAELHDLIPANLTVSEKLDWINKAETKGLFTTKKEVEIGKPMNIPHPEQDFSKMSAMDLFTMAYSKK